MSQVTPTSWVRFQKGNVSSPITAMSRIEVSAMSDGPGWLGLHLELGSTASGWDGDDLMVDGHFLAMNTADDTLHLEMRAEDDSSWRPYTRAPGAFWIHPEGRPFSLRHKGRSRFAAAIIDGRFLDSVLGQHYELRAGISVVDKVLEHLYRALIEELHMPSQASVRDAMVRSFVLALATRQGMPAVDIPYKGGLSASQLNSVLSWVEKNLDSRITVGTMASRVQLSSAHFSREFKRATGSTPWEHVVERRLQRAGLLLKDGESVCSTALQCGFFDQAHLSRLFKQRYGQSPSAYARQHQTGRETIMSDGSTLARQSL